MIYLDNAATSMPKPKAVTRAVVSAIERCGNPGRSGHQASLDAGRAIFDCRVSLAKLFQAEDPMRFVFCMSCTDALNQAIKGMLPEGGHVVTTALEHNSVLRPLHTMKEKQFISLSIVSPHEDGFIEPADITREINTDTKLVVVSQASNVTGAVQPVEAIADVCYHKAVPLLVDGAQSAGCIPVCLSTPGIDLYAFPGHKGLLGPQGAGGLYIGESSAPIPLREGGTGSSSMLLTQPLDMPDRYESGTAPTPAIAGMHAGAEFVIKNLNQILAVEKKRTEDLWEGLSGINGVALYGPAPDKPRVGVITCNIGSLDPPVATDRLYAEYGIACRAGLHCAPLAHRFLGTDKRGAIRFSVGPFTTQEDVRAAIKAVRSIARHG